jgi:L-fuculose-phosphate aldolase
MAEPYSGTRFTTIFRARTPVPATLTRELSWWCGHLAESDLTPAMPGGFAGNLSIRYKAGFIITSAGADLGHIREEDFTQVLNANPDRRQVTAIGLRIPSSESFIHYAIYKNRREIQAVIHGHDELVLEHSRELDLPITAMERPYGTLELMQEVLKVLGNHSYIILRNHGFLALGATLDEAGQEALRQQAAALNRTG